ncbi:MAG: lipopolysaccharide export LptBFGC system permease protein LptF, partial [Planctomycetota bacterium]
RLHRYYLKELAVNAAITFIVLFGVVLISLVYRGIQRSQGGELLDAAKITLFFALDAVPHLLTISFLIATVVTYTRAAQDRELLAVRAAGISPRVPMQSAVLVGIMLSVGASFANHYMIPAVHFMKYRVIKEVVRNAFINLNLGSDRIKLPGGRVLTFRERDAVTQDMLECTVYSPEPIANLTSRIIFVDRVSIPPTKDWDVNNDIQVVLSGVRQPSLGAEPLEGGELRITVPLDEIGSAGGRLDKDEDVASDQLLAEIMRGVHADPVRATYTLFRRCSFALMPALLAPIGFCIAEMASHRGRVFALMLALVPLAMFYLGEVLGARFLISTNNPWCGWMPVVLLSVVGVPLVWRQLRR